MTQPVSGGYPDWGRFQATSTKVYVQDDFTATGTLQEIGEFFVGDVPYVITQISNGPGDLVQFFVDFRQTSGGLFNLAAQTFVVNTFGAYAQCIPVGGPWMVVSYLSGGSSSDFTARMSGAWVPGTFNGSTLNASILHVAASSVGAGATSSVQTDITWPGAATVSLQGSAGNARIILSSIDRAGATTIFYRGSVAGPGTSLSEIVFLPPTPVEVQRINDHGSSQTVRTAISARMMSPGA